MIKELEAFALAHYEEGGHWVYETHTEADYKEIIAKSDGSLTDAKRLVREYWELMNEMEANTRFE